MFTQSPLVARGGGGMWSMGTYSSVHVRSGPLHVNLVMRACLRATRTQTERQAHRLINLALGNINMLGSIYDCIGKASVGCRAAAPVRKKPQC